METFGHRIHLNKMCGSGESNPGHSLITDFYNPSSRGTEEQTPKVARFLRDFSQKSLARPNTNHYTTTASKKPKCK